MVTQEKKEFGNWTRLGDGCPSKVSEMDASFADEVRSLLMENAEQSLVGAGYKFVPDDVEITFFDSSQHECIVAQWKVVAEHE